MNLQYNLNTLSPIQQNHVPKYFLVDAKEKTLGRLATQVSVLLRGKNCTFFTPHVDQGNFVVIINADQICVTGKKENQKFYFRNSQRPGSLKTESLKQLRKRIPTRIIEKAIAGMLPKGVLGRKYFRRLYIYSNATFLTLNKYEQKFKDFNLK